MKLLYTSLAALLFAGASAGAMAQMDTYEDNGTGGGATTFDSLDTDGDGALSAEEASAAGMDSQSVSELDTDGDGVISREEYEGATSQPGAGGQ